MRFLKDNKGKIISLIVILAALVLFYNLGESPKSKSGKTENPNEQTEISVLAENEKTESEKSAVSEKEEKTEKEKLKEDEENPAEEKKQEKEIKGKGMPAEEETPIKEEKIKPEKPSEPVMEKEAESTEKEALKPADEKHPAPIEPQTVTISDKELQCTISIRCDNILENLDKLEEAKWQLIPENGIILAEKTVSFYEGETVFNVLLRETRRNGIHMEYVNTPIYNSAYIEGIHNLYEFDCGELSGWMYSVNGWFPNYGCSRYALKDGDRIEWVYTCELGDDLKQR